MKKTVVVLLSIASVAGLATMATATPFTANNYQGEGLGNVVRAAGFNVSDVARGVGLGNVVPGGSFSTFGGGGTFTPGGGSFTPGGATGGVNSLTSSPLSTPVSGVPEGGSSLLLLGAGLFALALLRRRQMFSH